MLRIIVGQDPYRDTDNWLMVPNYPNTPVAFFKPTAVNRGCTFRRIIGLIYGNSATVINDTTQEVLNLAQEGFYFFNAYNAEYHVDGNKENILSFIEEYCEINDILKSDVHVLLCGIKAYKLLYKSLVEEEYNVYRAPHPSSSNNRRDTIVFWDDQNNDEGGKYVGNETTNLYFRRN